LYVVDIHPVMTTTTNCRSNSIIMKQKLLNVSGTTFASIVTYLVNE